MSSGHRPRYAFEAGSMTYTHGFAECHSEADLRPDNGTHVGPLKLGVTFQSPSYVTVTLMWTKAGRALAYRFSRS